MYGIVKRALPYIGSKEAAPVRLKEDFLSLHSLVMLGDDSFPPLMASSVFFPPSLASSPFFSLSSLSFYYSQQDGL